MQKKFKSFTKHITSFVLSVCVISFFNINVSAVYRPVYDFTGSVRTDFTVLTLQGATGSQINWKTFRNPAAGPGLDFIRVQPFGVVGDIVTAADWFGDGKTEISVYRPTPDFSYYETPFPEAGAGALTVERWGQGGDNLGRDGDYDGDGKDDETIIRISGGVLQWWIKGANGTNRVVTYGATATNTSLFAFQGADFNNDGRDEFVLARVANASGAAIWFIGDSITGAQIMQVSWGNFNTDYLINPDDYTGDGIAEIPVWRAGATNAADRVWYLFNPATGTQAAPIGLQFGIGDPNFVNNDLPLRGNYDDDNKADIAVFRPSTRTWYWIRSSDGGLGVQQWGDAGDTPLPSFFTF
jgi:hypothetical protein